MGEYVEKIKLLASELKDASPRTQLEIVKKCKDICIDIAEAIDNGEFVETSELQEIQDTITEMQETIASLQTAVDNLHFTGGNGVNITNANVINADLKVIEGANVDELTNEQCNALNVGDIVSIDNIAYAVREKTDNDLILVNVANNFITITTYTKNNNVWEYQGTEETTINSLHCYYAIFNKIYNDNNSRIYATALIISNSKITSLQDIYNYYAKNLGDNNANFYMVYNCNGCIEVDNGNIVETSIILGINQSRAYPAASMSGVQFSGISSSYGSNIGVTVPESDFVNPSFWSYFKLIEVN